VAQQKRAPGEIKFSYGGQAVIEGVMMRGAHTAMVACRDPKGQIITTKRDLSQTLYRGWIAKTPFVRGVVGLWDALGLGTWALMWAADVALDENDKEKGTFNGVVGFGTVALSLAIGIGLFFILPTTAATGIGSALGLHTAQAAQTANVMTDGIPIGVEATIINIIENVIQLALLIGYIMLIGQMKDVKRLFGYHGAEHKTINAYEAGAELTPEIVATYPIEHPRCGTAFLLTVVFVSIFVFSLLGRPPLPLLILSRVLLIPVIAGIAYELIRWSANNLHRGWVRMIVKPNLMLQHLTTREPDLHMVEVAIVSFKQVLLSEGLIQQEEAAIPAARPEAAYSVGD
jgi:uncharacterized protein YqhQ